ncbi:TSPc domain-containing protein, partial [Haematococcus lacustris]
TSAAVESALLQGELEGVAGYVLDLRNDPGGVFEEAVATAALFLEPGCTVAATVGGEGWRGTLDSAVVSHIYVVVRNEEVVDAVWVAGQLPSKIFPSLPANLVAGAQQVLVREVQGVQAVSRLLLRPLAAPLTPAPVVLLANANSASAAEVSECLVLSG